MVQWDEQPLLDSGSGHGLRVLGSGSELSTEPALGFSLSLCSSLPASSQINTYLKNPKNKQTKNLRLSKDSQMYLSGQALIPKFQSPIPLPALRLC